MNAHELALRVVHLDDVLMHEHIERQRVDNLLARLQNDQLLKNPPIVAQADAQYILLDGATRVTALQRLGCRDVVVQIVDYEMAGVALESWSHLLIGLAIPDFLQSLRQLPGLTLHVATVEQAAHTLAQHESIGTVLLADGHALSMHGADSLAGEAHLLNQIVAVYEGRGKMHRVAHADLKRLQREFARWSVVIVFPRYRPSEIRRLALNGNKLPTGITRHIIPGRAMRLNLPLDLFKSDESLANKNRWLDEWLAHKLEHHHVRYYQEPVFLFDE